MAKDKLPEVWLRGPLTGMPLLLQPVAHALLQAREELSELMADFQDVLLWEKVAGMASVGFHLQHLTGVLDRLFTYAQGEQLSAEQLDYLAKEGKYNEAVTAIHLIEKFDLQIDAALKQLEQTDIAILTQQREVGRGKLPSTVIGLYVHGTEHTMRHLGQLIVTVKVLTQSV